MSYGKHPYFRDRRSEDREKAKERLEEETIRYLASRGSAKARRTWVVIS